MFERAGLIYRERTYKQEQRGRTLRSAVKELRIARDMAKTGGVAIESTGTKQYLRKGAEGTESSLPFGEGWGLETDMMRDRVKEVDEEVALGSLKLKRLQ